MSEEGKEIHGHETVIQKKKSQMLVCLDCCLETYHESELETNECS